MNTRHSRTLLSLIVAGACLAACYLAATASADTPNAGKTKKAVEAAEAATKNANDAADSAAGAALAAAFGTHYPDTDDGRAAQAADKDADSADAAAEAAEKEAANARAKACKSGKAEDEKAAETAEKAARDAETGANAADVAADKGDRKADPNGKQLQSRKRDAERALRAALRVARAAICFARKCAELMDESSELSKKRKKETVEKIDGLGSSVDQLALAPPPPGAAEVKTAQGLYTVTFTTLQGRVIVNLPDDMRAGDTISGTVVAEPKGQTPEDRAKNMAVLSGYVIEVQPPRKPDGTSSPKVRAEVNAPIPQLRVTLPLSIPTTPPLKSVSSTNSGGLGITLTNTTGSFTVGGTTTVPIEMVSLSLQSVAPLKVPQLPTIGQQGRPVEIIGPFQVTHPPTLMYGPPGATVQDFEKNTENVSGGFGLIQPLAESPRKCVFEAPTNVTGPIELYLKEGNQETKGTYRNLGVNLTAPKTSLMKGESTELHVEVQGLQGIKEPVPLRLTKGGVVTMQGGDIQTMSIKPAEVQTNGTYTTTRTITGVQTGAWNATATVVVFDLCLQDDKTGDRLQFNSTTGDYIFCAFPTVVAGDNERAAFSFLGTTTPETGSVGWSGCTITLQHNSTDGRVTAQLDKCTQTGSATVQPAASKTKFTITDRDTRNNTCACK